MPQLLSATVLNKKRVATGESIWLADSACRGLRVRIANTATAGRTVIFYYRYKDRTSGKLKPVSIGQYPGLGLEAARQLVDHKLRPLADAGTDVRLALKQERANDAVDAKRTIKALIPDYLAYADRRGRSMGTIKAYRRYLRPLAVWWGDRLPISITRGDVADIFDKVKREGVPPFDIDGKTPIERRGPAKGGHRAAGQTLSAGRAFWSWLVDRELAPFNPWQGQKLLAEESKSGTSDRALSDKEISAVLEAAALKLGNRDKTILRLLLATGLRPNEVCAAQWLEIDLRSGIWHIPGHRMKYKKADHVVFLSTYAHAVLSEWRSGQRGRHRYVFPSSGTVHPHVVSDNLVERFKQLGVEGFSPKVCRATVRTGLQRLGCPEEVRSRISHHQRGDKVSRSYDHHSFDLEAKHWWEQWGAHLEKLATSAPGLAEVVRLEVHGSRD